MTRNYETNFGEWYGQLSVQRINDVYSTHPRHILDDVSKFVRWNQEHEKSLRPVNTEELLQPGYDNFTICSDAHLIGFVSLSPEILHEGELFRKIGTLFVLPSYRGHSLADKLVKTAVDEAGSNTFAFVKGDDLGKAKAFTRNGFVTGEMPWAGSRRPALIRRQTQLL